MSYHSDTETKTHDPFYKQPKYILGAVIAALIVAGFYSWNGKRTLENEAQKLISNKNQQIKDRMEELTKFRGQNAELDLLMTSLEEEVVIKRLELDSVVKLFGKQNRFIDSLKRDNIKLYEYKKQQLLYTDSLTKIIRDLELNKQ